jgi:hypothetical protein
MEVPMKSILISMVALFSIASFANVIQIIPGAEVTINPGQRTTVKCQTGGSTTAQVEKYCECESSGYGQVSLNLYTLNITTGESKKIRSLGTYVSLEYSTAYRKCEAALEDSRICQ